MQEQPREHRGSDQCLHPIGKPLSPFSAQNKAQVWVRHMIHCASCSAHLKTGSDWLDRCPERVYPAPGPCIRPQDPGDCSSLAGGNHGRSQWPVPGPGLGLARLLALSEGKTDHNLRMIIRLCDLQDTAPRLP